MNILLAVLGSTGLWTLINNLISTHKEKKSLERKALLALLHDKLYFLCQNYIELGQITIEELENIEYLYAPYRALGGNGTCERLYDEVLKIPIKRK